MTCERDNSSSTGVPPQRPLPVVRARALVAAGVLCVAIGTVGVFVPLLPTTPFLLLAAACFARSSDRFYTWLMTHRWFGPTIRNYRERRGTTLRVKIVAIIILWCSIGISSAFLVRNRPALVVLALVGIGVTAHLATLSTIRAPETHNP